MTWAVLLSIAGLLGLLISGVVRPAIAFVGLAGAYLLLDLVDTATLLAQYTNPALATLLLLLLVSLALERTPLLDWLSQRLLTGSEKTATARLMGASAVLSAFLNNTAVVARLPRCHLASEAHRPLAAADPALLRLHPGWHDHPGRHLYQPGGQLLRPG